MCSQKNLENKLSLGKQSKKNQAALVYHWAIQVLKRGHVNWVLCAVDMVKQSHIGPAPQQGQLRICSEVISQTSSPAENLDVFLVPLAIQINWDLINQTLKTLDWLAILLRTIAISEWNSNKREAYGDVNEKNNLKTPEAEFKV